MIIDQTYFVRRLNVPQAGNTEGLADLNGYIEQYEPEFLSCVLGYDLAKAFNEGIDGSGLPSEQRWIDLLEGAEFSQGGCLYRWSGFKPVTGVKVSPIANYVFFKFVDEKITDFTLVGTVSSKTDNNRTASAIDRLVDTWNRMVDMNKILYRFLKVNKTAYPEWKICACPCDDVDHCGCGCNCDPRTPKGCGNLFAKINSLGL